MAIRAEFTIFPFREGNEMPAHVQAGIDAAPAAVLVSGDCIWEE